MIISYNRRSKWLTWKAMGGIFVVNTVIGIVLNFIYQAHMLWIYILVSQCIGFCTCTFCCLSLAVFKPRTSWGLVIILAVAITLGGLLGGWAGGRLIGHELVSFTSPTFHTWRIVIMSLLISGGISFFFFSRGQMAETQQLLQQERIQRLTSEKNATLAQLKLLQAQIEPHFLFNTLSNILSLLETDPPGGKKMLRDLIRYLRASLSESRRQWTTLGGEMELITAYLDLFKVRMGDRLQVRIEMDNALKTTPFAPMLIQPLVENALLHGLEDMVAGGTISIHTGQENGSLRVTVADSGKGFASEISRGLGLANVRERLKALYGRQGRLVITENQPSGVKAVIEVPYAASR